jgi:antitoxin HicB
MTDISHYLGLPYTKILKRDEEGDVIATIAELDGCMAHGSDEAEALGNLREAQAAWLEHAFVGGQDIPVPEVEEELPSGKFVVRVPRSLHQRLNKLARKDDVSLNQVMVSAATEYMARREVRDEMSIARKRAAQWQGVPRGGWSRTERPSAPEQNEFLQVLRAKPVLVPNEEDGPHVPHHSRVRA